MINTKFEQQPRLEEQEAFVDRCGWSGADLYPMSSDASFRTYTRLVHETGRCLLMDAPPDYEDLGAYLKVRKYLDAIGLRVPAVYGEDEPFGFALIEDFGDDTFTKLLASGSDGMSLYEQAVDVLVHLHRQSVNSLPDVPSYDLEVLQREADLFIDWFIPAAYGRDITADERTAYHSAWGTALQSVAKDRRALVLRDFHVDNLMILSKETGLNACGLLDFQDALIGSKSYDMVSLLEDARLDVPDSTRKRMLDRYFAAFPATDKKAFQQDMDVLGAQRHAKVAGIFVRLNERDGKDIYLKHIPRVLNLLEKCLRSDALSEVRICMETLAPDFHKQVITS